MLKTLKVLQRKKQKQEGMKNMQELKLKTLFRGYILTDFDGNDMGIKDAEHAIEEIKKLLTQGNSSNNIVNNVAHKEKELPANQIQFDEKDPGTIREHEEYPLCKDEFLAQDNNSNNRKSDGEIHKDNKKGSKRHNYIELHRKIFEIAKDQISISGRTNGAEISRILRIGISSVYTHLGKMNKDLDILIRKKNLEMLIKEKGQKERESQCLDLEMTNGQEVAIENITGQEDDNQEKTKNTEYGKEEDKNLETINEEDRVKIE